MKGEAVSISIFKFALCSREIRKQGNIHALSSGEQKPQTDVMIDLNVKRNLFCKHDDIPTSRPSAGISKDSVASRYH